MHPFEMFIQVLSRILVMQKYDHCHVFNPALKYNKILNFSKNICYFINNSKAKAIFALKD
jgi:hypothetical protein